MLNSTCIDENENEMAGVSRPVREARAARFSSRGRKVGGACRLLDLPPSVSVLVFLPYRKDDGAK